MTRSARRIAAALSLALAALALPARLLGASHPLEPLSPAEIQETYEVVQAHFRGAPGQLPPAGLSFPSLWLQEPSKAFVLDWSPGEAVPRQARVEVMHRASNRLYVVLVDLVANRVVDLQLMPLGTQAAVTAEEFVIAEELVSAYAPWRQAMAARGLDPDEVYVDVWAPGDVELPPSVVLAQGAETRLLQALAFHRGGDPDDQDAANPQNPYVRPIEGVVVTLDMNAGRVAHMVDTGVKPVATDSGNAPSRRPLRPLVVHQPDGASAHLAGRTVKWQRWRFYAFLHPREGLVLADVRHRGSDGRYRRIAYRLSLSEIYVPYGLADDNWAWRTAFDVGEYNLGLYAQSLESNRDVPENTLFLDAVFGSDVGPSDESADGTVEYPETIGIYERDGGILWTRTDPSTYERDTRLARELVVTWNAWIGNYIYGFDWIFGMDGSIRVETQLLGTLLLRGGDVLGQEASAPAVGVDPHGVVTRGPNHQHFFSFRLDLDVDGPVNVVEQSDVLPVVAAGFENAFDAQHTEIGTEGAFDLDHGTARSWEVRSATRRNAFGRHTAYEIHPGETAVPLSSEGFPALQRAQFARHPFWVTRYRDGELYAAGQHPSQGPVGDGLPAFTSPAEALPESGEDVVVWYTAGHTHVPRPEDYPVMPAATVHFELLPHGFFDRNPALDAPDQAAEGEIAGDALAAEEP
jgi:primary-amine oxidase